MPLRRPAPIWPDILHLAQDNLGTADHVTVFGGLFDAAIRATWTMALSDTRRIAILCGAVDRLLEEIERKTLVQVCPALVAQLPCRKADAKANHPALKPR